MSARHSVLLAICLDLLLFAVLDVPLFAQANADEDTQTRKVALRFLGATVGVYSDSLWSAAKLKVRLEDENGRLLATCDKPARRTELLLPAGLKRVFAVAKGYRRTTVDLEGASGPQQSVDRRGTTRVVMQPDASVRLRPGGLPWQAGNEYRVRLSLVPERHGITRTDLLGGPENVTPERGFVFAVPSGIKLRLRVTRIRQPDTDQDNLHGIELDVPALRPEESREVEVGRLQVLRGRLLGISKAAFHERLLQANTGAMWTQLRLAAHGRFRVLGDGATQLSLSVQTDGYRHVGLRSTKGEVRRWSIGVGDEILVEPKERLAAVVTSRNGRSMTPMAIGLGSRPSPSEGRARARLYRLDALQRVRVFFWAKGIGNFEASLAERQPDARGLITIEAPPPGGRVEVVASDEIEDHVFAMLQPLDRKTKLLGVSKRSAGGWVFDGAEPGRYRILLRFDHSYGGRFKLGRYFCQTELGDPIEVKSAKTLKRTVTLPKLLSLHGEIEDWRKIPLKLRPSRVTLVHPSWSHSRGIRDGKFTFHAFAPWIGVRELRFSGSDQGEDVVTRKFSTHAEGLRAKFPNGSESRAKTR